MIEEVENPLETFYLSEFKNNTNRYCDFEVAEELSDAFDRSLSDQQNEVEQFKLAYMAISGSRLDEKEAQRMMEQLGIINLPDPQAKVGYVTKDINKDFNEYHLDKLKKLYYTVTKSIDFNDEVFKSNSSGEARKWQIIALEAKTNTKEQYFKEGLKEAAETMSAFIKFRDKLDVDVSKIVFTFSRSLPTDIGYLADALPKLSPFVSKRTIINQIPFVKDPDYEMDLMNLEQGQDYPSGEYDELGGAVMTKKKTTASERYWEKRRGLEDKARLKLEKKTLNELESVFERALVKIQRQLLSQADLHDITQSEMLEDFSKRDQEKYRKYIEKNYEKLMESDEAYKQFIDEYFPSFDYAKVNRLLQLRADIFSTLAGEAISSDVNGKFNNDLENITKRIYNSNSNTLMQLLGGSAPGLSKKELENILNYPWSGKTFHLACGAIFQV